MRSGTRAGRDAWSACRWSECFVWLWKLCHMRKAIHPRLSRKAWLVVRKTAGASEGWREFAVELGRQIRRFRVEKDLSQEALAFRAGLTRFTVQRYEAGEGQTGSPANPSLRTIVALAQVLDVPLEDLIPANRPDVTTR